MKLSIFRRAIPKPVFTWEEARTVAFSTSLGTLKLQLHNWNKSGEVVRLRRGVYAFRDGRPETADLLRALYPPAYVSLESALAIYGIIPEVPFATTAVTPRPTRSFTTPWGRFLFRRIRTEAFAGFDPVTLLAEREKAVADYLFVHRRRLLALRDVWEERRWTSLDDFDFERARKFGRLLGSRQVVELLKGLERHATDANAS